MHVDVSGLFSTCSTIHVFRKNGTNQLFVLEKEIITVNNDIPEFIQFSSSHIEYAQFEMD